MKPKWIFLLLLFNFLIGDLVAQDHDPFARTHKLFISTYPSAVFTGDISLGVEHAYKRLRQELGILYKSFRRSTGIDPWPEYLYDAGYGINYHLKYGLYSTKNMALSLDLGYIYRKGSYKNKVEAPVYYSEFDFRSTGIYRMDRKNTFSGLSAGFSGLFKLYRYLYAGFNLYLNYGEAYQLFTLK